MVDGAGVDGDCDDARMDVHPGAGEVCDELDGDCDGAVDEDASDAGTWYTDMDEDGFGDAAVPVLACASAAGIVANADDCDDGDDGIHPDAPETCDDADQDCDGAIDDGATDPTTFYLDVDGDGYGTDALEYVGCGPIDGYVAEATDCDDTDASISPAGTEVCGGTDEDCDGTVDEDDAGDAPTWFADADADAYGAAGTGRPACLAPSGTVSDATDCDDADASVSPGDPEVCGGADEDCDGDIDEDDASDAVDHYTDADGDGYGDEATHAYGCLPAGAVTTPGDCDDTTATVSPAAAETCGDATDDDCDGDAPACFTGTYTTADADASILSTTVSDLMGSVADGGDVTGDGVDDLVVSAYGSSNTYVFAGPVTTTTPSTATYTISPAAPTVDYQSRGLWAERDVNADGVNDLVLYPCSTISTADILCVLHGPITSGTSTLMMDVSISASSPAALGDADLGDIDGDGLDEMVVAYMDNTVYAFPAAYYGLFENVAYPSSYTTKISFSPSTLADTAVGDLDGDGLDEIVTGHGFTSYIFSAPGTAATDADALATITDGWTYSRLLILPDLDGDGLDDLAQQASSDASPALWVTSGAMAGGSWSTLTALTVTGPSYGSFPYTVDGEDSLTVPTPG